ncbi:copper amine oxidase N-terminal domain-containing protein [Paenibacillus sp. TRM 82003]|nr:copper amine oxidase N-terminal domain-containing protein [Paenibacillus sp. TRM 82003]
MKKGKRWLLAAATAGAMLTTMGCEAVQGVDVGSALAAKTELRSMEGEMTLEWKLTPDAATMPDARTAAVLGAFGDGALRVTEWKQASPHKASLSGTIELRKGTIGFDAYLDGPTLILDVEGAKRPFRFDLADLLGDGPAMGGAMQGNELFGALTSEDGTKALQAVEAYVIGKTPTPANASLERVEETIGGDAMTVTKVRMAVPGDKADDTARVIADAILADEAGVKALLGTLFDAFAPELRNAEGTKPLAVNLLYQAITPILTDLKTGVAEDIFTADSEIALSVLVDGIAPVGTELKLSLSPADGQYDGLRRIEASASTRWWNANGDVTAETYEGQTAAFELDAKPRERLANVTEGSLLYDLLKNDLALTTHSFHMFMGGNASVPDGLSPYIKGAGTTMVPVRYVSEQLDATVDWNGETRTITIKDEAEGVTIVMVVDDETATVNGAEQKLPASPEIVFNSTFVPIAFITKALGGAATWNAGNVTITKEF